MELHPEELQLSGDEEGQDAGRDDQAKGLKIRRTITQVRARSLKPENRGGALLMTEPPLQPLRQVVPSEGHENGQTKEEEEEEEEMETAEDDAQPSASRDQSQSGVCEEAPEPQPSVNMDGEAAKGKRTSHHARPTLAIPEHALSLSLSPPPTVTPSDSVVRRSISQQKSGVSVTIDDPVRTTRQPSPSRGKLSNIVHVTNLVGPRVDPSRRFCWGGAEVVSSGESV